MASTGFAAPTTPAYLNLIPIPSSTPVPSSTAPLDATSKLASTALQQTQLSTLSSGAPVIVISSTRSDTVTAPSSSLNTAYVIQVQVNQQRFFLASNQPFTPGTALTLQTQGTSGQLQVVNSAPELQRALSASLVELAQHTAFTEASFNGGLPKAQQDLHALLQVLRNTSITLPTREHTLKTGYQLSAQLDQHIIPLKQLTPTLIARTIANSGLFLEAHLLAESSDKKASVSSFSTSPFSTSQQADLKATLTQLLTLAKGLQGDLKHLENHTALDTVNKMVSTVLTRTPSLLSNSAATIERQFNALLTQQFMQIQQTAANGQNHVQAITQTLAVSALLSFWCQRHNTVSPQNTLGAGVSRMMTGNNPQSGWDILMSLLAGAPHSQRMGSSSFSSLSNTTHMTGLLEGLITTLEAKLSSIRSTQLHMLVQRENTSDSKTLCNTELLLQTNTTLEHIPLHIEQRAEKATKTNQTTDKVWRFRLGFDLDEKGTVFASGAYHEGSLTLSFQTEKVETQHQIAQHIDQLQTPLQQHGITVSNIDITLQGAPTPNTSTITTENTEKRAFLKGINIIDITL